jgi:hypothetical protein
MNFGMVVTAKHTCRTIVFGAMTFLISTSLQVESSTCCSFAMHMISSIFQNIVFGWHKGAAKRHLDTARNLVGRNALGTHTAGSVIVWAIDPIWSWTFKASTFVFLRATIGEVSVLALLIFAK